MPNLKRGMMGAAGGGPGEKSLYAWGANGNGGLGVGDTVVRTSPTLVGEKNVWTQFTPGQGGGWLLKYDGTAWAFGPGTYGRLGQNDDLRNYSAPVQIGTLDTWTDIRGARHTGFAVKDDGTLWSWGFNSQGETGLGNALNSSSPVQVGSATDWAGVKIGAGSTVAAVKASGQLWMWGTDGNGCLGAGTNNVNKSVPVQLGALTDWSKVSPGGYHIIGLRTNGTLWGWGSNFNGAAGVGLSHPNSVSSPVQIGSRTDWKDIATGRRNSAGITTDGKLWTWGGAANGENGRGSVLQDSSPVQVGSLTTWNTFSDTGFKIRNFLHVTKTDGTIWGFGLNNYRQLLDGTTINRSSPVQVGVDAGWSSVAPGDNAAFILYP